MFPNTHSALSYWGRGRRGRLTTYDLVSRGKNVTDKNQCWGYYDSTTKIGYGPGYVNSCIHSDSNDYSGGNTVWYNYVIATAGTIFDENTTQSNPATNITTATESICPKGWTLPSKTQIDSQRNIASFSPVLGGDYYNGALYNEATGGRWWGNEASNSATRYSLRYNGSSLYTHNSDRNDGFYVRCVQAS